MSATHLNLARKWRSKQFDQIIGQDLSVRMLKNSLYLDQLFPVYLFSGQRGCGKTTTARVFASAINCEQLSLFKVEPKKTLLPCLTCTSCQAMLEGRHPDFIEMDAASHTGVDNVRNIIDAASLMPILGRKKIYLIDEAHMLSKSAFNAFLKILEEPPVSVLFILATTDPEKIIETVRSRCFQVFFKSIEAPILLHYLEDICVKEGIAYETAGLELIIKETEGSARDALNMLEAVRFSAATISKVAVFQLLGHVQEDQVIALLEAVFSGNHERVLKTMQQIACSAQAISFLWESFLQLLHACIWIKHHIKPDAYTHHESRLKKILRNISWLQLHHCLKFCYEHEQLFLKTSNQIAFFEMLLLQMAMLHKTDEESGSGFSAISSIATTASHEISQEDEDGDEDDDEDDQEDDDIREESTDFKRLWHRFIDDIAILDDPLISSIFKQSSFTSYDPASGHLHIVFSKKFSFFQDLLENGKHHWMPLLKKQFNNIVIFNPAFTGEDAVASTKKYEQSITEPVKQVTVAKKIITKQAPSAKPMREFRSPYTPKAKHAPQPTIDVSNKDEWKKAHMVLQYFSGTVHEINESLTL